MTGLSLKTSSARKPRKRIMIFGTFDVMHKGHDHFFQQARSLAGIKGQPYLVVSLARDKNVLRIKGRKPLYGERKRLKIVSKHPLVDKAVLGGLSDHIPHIFREKPDIIALGYDQRDYIAGLRAALKQRGLDVKIVRLKAHQPNKFKSSIVKKQLSKKPAKN